VQKKIKVENGMHAGKMENPAAKRPARGREKIPVWYGVSWKPRRNIKIALNDPLVIQLSFYLGIDSLQ